MDCESLWWGQGACNAVRYAYRGLYPSAELQRVLAQGTLLGAQVGGARRAPRAKLLLIEHVRGGARQAQQLIAVGTDATLGVAIQPWRSSWK